MTFTSVHSRVGKYELGRTLGQGSFGKVKLAKNLETGESVAIKVLDKEKIFKHKMVEQIKREISTMRLVKHPNIVQLLEVLASKTKVYIVLEFVTGGQLYDRIVHQGFLKEAEARKYFQQLINAVDYCHSRGVYHRDLKPQNLLLDMSGNLKISDFGFSALPQQHREDGLLYTMCGTPSYVAPEVINNKGYKGATADLWSCGVILFALMAGYLPFRDSNLMTLYKKISLAHFTCPSWFSSGARKLILRILDPNPGSRITVPQILEAEWFKKGYQRAKFREEEDDVHLVDVDAFVNDSTEHLVLEKKERKPVMMMNAFELISLSRGLNLSGLFNEQPESGNSIIIGKEQPLGGNSILIGKEQPLGGNSILIGKGQPLGGDSIIIGRGPRNSKGYPWNVKWFGGCFKCFVKVYLVCGSKCGPKGPHLQRLDSIAY